VHAQARLTPHPPPGGYDPSTALPFRLLAQEVQRLARDPFLADRFREAVDKGEPADAFRHFDFARFVERTGLRPLERLVLAAAVLSAPTRKELGAQALSVVRIEFENAVLALCQRPCFDQGDLAPQQVGKLLGSLLSDLPGDAPVLDAGQRQALILAAHAKFGPEAVSPILQRILPSIRCVIPSVLERRVYADEAS
jgi:CCR4-NOT transcription complex subunit 1